MTRPLTALCTYRVPKDREKEFLEHLSRHWPALRDFGLATEARPHIYRGEDDDGAPYFVEIFDWSDETAVDRAHEHPEVMAIWEPMGALCVERAGRPAMEFPHVERIDLHPKRTC